MTGRRAGAEFPIKYTSVTVSTVVHLTQSQYRLKTAVNPHCQCDQPDSERLGVSTVPLPSTSSIRKCLGGLPHHQVLAAVNGGVIVTKLSIS